MRSPQNRFSQHWRLSENFSSTRQKIATRSMFCKVQESVFLLPLAVILVLPLPGFKKPNTTSGSTAAFTTDCMQSLATFKTVPRKQVGSPATLATLRWGPASHAWLINTCTVWLAIESSWSVPDEHGESGLREDDGVVTTGVGTGLVTTGCVGGISGVFLLSCFSGFSGFAGFGGLTGLSSLSAFSFTLPLRKQTLIIRSLAYILTRIAYLFKCEAFCNRLFFWWGGRGGGWIVNKAVRITFPLYCTLIGQLHDAVITSESFRVISRSYKINRNWLLVSKPWKTR